LWEARPPMELDKLLVILASLVFAASIIVFASLKHTEMQSRARRWRHREPSSDRRSRHNHGHSTIVAHLADSGPGRIVVGGQTLRLRDGEACAYTVGTPIRVVYTVVDGQFLVDGMMAVRPPE